MSDKPLPHGPLGTGAVHLCVDMQRMFAERTDWHTPWMARVRPVVHRIAARFPERTLFTRFIPPRDPRDAQGSWRRYYERWESMTLDRLGAGMVDWSRTWRHWCRRRKCWTSACIRRGWTQTWTSGSAGAAWIRWS